jgi:hypothetical protein
VKEGKANFQRVARCKHCKQVLIRATLRDGEWCHLDGRLECKVRWPTPQTICEPWLGPAHVEEEEPA